MRFYLVFMLLSYSILYSKVMNFSWKSSGDKYSYKVQISYDDLFKKIFIEEVVKTNNYIADIPPGKYYFRVIPLYKSFEGDPSVNISFLIEGDGVKERLDKIEPREALENIIVPKEERLRLKANFKNREANIEYNVNEIKNFRIVSNEIEINTLSMPDGEHNLYYRTDYNSKKGKIKELNFKIDRTPPVVIISGRFKKIGQREYVYPESRIDINISDENIKEKIIWLNGKKITSELINVTSDYHFLRLTIFASDSNNNVTTFTKNYYLDVNPPTIKFEKVLKSPLLFLDISDETSIKEISITINDKKYFTNVVNLAFFKNGIYPVIVQAVDIFENTNVLNFNMRIKNEKDWEGFIE
ncbi:MAG: hypothetical protein N2258_08920 [Brevinematales bacterium]|nr:hypothetical protein [Brevinematales bacterium]